MQQRTFDRLTRVLANRRSRRGLLAGAAALAAQRGRPAAAIQLGPPACGGAGDVCTMLLGCCEGLTCVTSAINVNYGICVTGSGGTVSAGTSLISPFAEGAAEEAASLASGSTGTSPTDTTSSGTTSTGTTPTDPQAAHQQRQADKKARKDAQQSRQSSRKTTRRNRRQNQKDARQLKQGPKLDIRIQCFDPVNPEVPEVVRILNDDTIAVTVERLESVIGLNDDSPQFQYSLEPGDFVRFRSNIPPSSDPNDWSNLPVFDDGPKDGVRVFVSTATQPNGHSYTVLCDGSKPGNGHHKNKRRRAKKRGNGGK